jgi:signal peptidase II
MARRTTATAAAARPSAAAAKSSPKSSPKSSAPSTGMWPWLILALAVLVADQASKLWIVNFQQLGESTPFTSFFNLVRVHNHGAAFSFLAAAGGWQRWFFMGLGLVAAAFIVWMLKSHPGQKLFALAMSCILGGALGNVLDRIAYGYVIDFLDFHWGAWHFPAFNVADCGITLGAIALVLDELLRVRKQR